jgi:hypothetical protein
MRNKPIHLGKGNQIVNDLVSGIDFGTFLFDYMKTDPLNFIQIGFADKVDIRMTSGEYEGRPVFYAFFAEAGSGAPASKGHIEASGLTFFQGVDDQAAVNLFVQIDRATSHATATLQIMQRFDMYRSKNAQFRLTKDHSLLPAIIYANLMLHHLAAKKGDEKIEASYVNWAVQNYLRQLSQNSLQFFKDNPDVTANRLSLALIKNDVRADVDLTEMENIQKRHVVSTWLRNNMDVIKECEVDMANKDYHALT